MQRPDRPAIEEVIYFGGQPEPDELADQPRPVIAYKKMSVDKCREFVPSSTLTDSELRVVRDQIYQLAEIVAGHAMQEDRTDVYTFLFDPLGEIA
ncbi:MAG: hypothetical protein M3Y72_15960 [Acidobacteriota bacterium]|nr:hypothetical protein [Acidobacteriota bacterium]